jgi:hypothetical protein
VLADGESVWSGSGEADRSLSVSPSYSGTSARYDDDPEGSPSPMFSVTQCEQYKYRWTRSKRLILLVDKVAIGYTRQGKPPRPWILRMLGAITSKQTSHIVHACALVYILPSYYPLAFVKSEPSEYPPTFSQSIFCLVTGNARRRLQCHFLPEV